MIGLIIVFSLFYAMSMFFVLARDRDGILMNVYNVILLAFVVIFCILFPIAYLFASFGYVGQVYAEAITSMDALKIAYYYLIAAVVSHSFLVVLRNNKSMISNEGICDIETENEYKEQHYFHLAILLFVIGLVCDVLYLRAYGSYANYLLYSGALRSGVITVNNPFSFLVTFRKCINISSYVFFSQLFNRSLNIKITFVLFCVSFFFAFRVMYADKGRLSMIIYVLVLLIFAVSHRTQKLTHINGKIIRIGSIILIIFLVSCFVIGNLLNRNSSDNIILEIVEEFSFPFVNFAKVIESFSFDNARFFIDTLLFPVFLLPSRLWQVQWNIHTASEYTTVLLVGSAKGDNGIMGEMPIDLVSLSYIQFGILGIVIIPILFALLFCKAYEFIKKIKEPRCSDILSIYVVISFGIETIFYADPQHIIRRLFGLIVFVLLMHLGIRIKSKINIKW